MKALPKDQTAILVKLAAMAKLERQADLAEVSAEEQRIRGQISSLTKSGHVPESLLEFNSAALHAQWIGQRRKQLFQELVLVLARKETTQKAFALATAREQAASRLDDGARVRSLRTREARRLEEIQHMAMLSQARATGQSS
jgi:hypothetical protein